jgi:hypothetical protein
MPNRYRNTIAVELLAALTRLIVRAPKGASCWRGLRSVQDDDPELLYIKLADGRTFSVSLEEVDDLDPRNFT